MAVYNLNTLLHRSFNWEVALPDGSKSTGVSARNIPVRIPKIQRDYAEGRDTESIQRKRFTLLNDILDVVYGIRPTLSFDFIYGYLMSNGHNVTGNEWQKPEVANVCFEPLDGQQRLTTLFLLYWFFGREADIRDAETGHSLLIYETRDTSEEFCHWLVNQDAGTVMADWQKAVSETESINQINKTKWDTEMDSRGTIDPYANRLRFPLMPVPTLFDFMQSADTFKWDWHNDPNIHSMITVLESTYSLLKHRGLGYDDGRREKGNLDNVSFMLLDNLECDGDRLFEKMNARGKALTDFEILKSSLEEEMERQGLPVSDAALTESWRNDVDGDWIDYCWDNSEIGAEPQLDTIREVENKLEKLLVSMAAKSFFTTDIVGTAPITGDAVNFMDLLNKSIYSNDRLVIERYLDYSAHERAIGNKDFSRLDFQSIHDDIRNLLYKDSSGWHDASSFLTELYHPWQQTLLEEFIDKPTHNNRVMIYAMLAYLRIVSADKIAVDATEKSNFVDWMRFIRNVYNSANKNSGLDNSTDVSKAAKAIDLWLSKYEKSYRNNKSKDVLRLIFDYIKDNPNGQEQARLDEEAIKAEIRIYGTDGCSSKDWEDSILKAESNYYLWGQIIAPLSWCCKDDSYDKELFERYTVSLDRMFDGSNHDNELFDALLIRSMLSLSDYRHNLSSGLGSLGRLNNNRDYSWKQYLRKLDTASGYYGILFKTLIDGWLAESMLSCEEYMEKMISAHKNQFSKYDWQYYIVNLSDANSLLDIFELVRTNSRYVYTESNGHAYYFRSDTLRTQNRYELLTTFLYYETGLLQDGVEYLALAHTADTDGAHVDFKMPNGDAVRLSPAEQTFYNIALRPNGTDAWVDMHKGLSVSEVESELKRLGVVKHL